MAASCSFSWRIGIRPKRALALALGLLPVLFSVSASAKKEDEWGKTRLLAETNWTPEKLKEASEADPPGSLFEKVGEDGVVWLDSAIMLNRGCEQTYNAVDLEDQEKLSLLFGKTVIIQKVTKTDNGFDVIGAESAMGFTSDPMPVRWVLDEGDPQLRKVSMKGLDPEKFVEGDYSFIDVGSPEHCIFAINIGAELPGWLPNWILRLVANFGANKLSDSMREGLGEEAMWPADKQAPIRTPKGKRDRKLWLAKQNPVAPVEEPAPTNESVVDAVPPAIAAPVAPVAPAGEGAQPAPVAGEDEPVFASPKPEEEAPSAAAATP